MCVAIVTKEGAVIPSNTLLEGWKNNPHGGGFAFVDDDHQVVIKKGYMKFSDFVQSYEHAAAKFADRSPFLVHMRIRTSGDTSPSNCHPFKVKDGAMIHNGVLFTPAGSRAGTETDRKSDTRVFAESLHNILRLEHIKKVSDKLRYAVGEYNKLCFLNKDKEYHIVGESSGYWSDNIWYSNLSCGLWKQRGVSNG